MKEIPVYSIIPVVLTKDRDWVEREASDITFQQGEIIVLPEDAVLYIPTETVQQLAPTNLTELE